MMKLHLSTTSRKKNRQNEKKIIIISKSDMQTHSWRYILQLTTYFYNMPRTEVDFMLFRYENS